MRERVTEGRVERDGQVLAERARAKLWVMPRLGGTADWWGVVELPRDCPLQFGDRCRLITVGGAWGDFVVSRTVPEDGTQRVVFVGTGALR